VVRQRSRRSRNAKNDVSGLQCKLPRGGGVTNSGPGRKDAVGLRTLSSLAASLVAGEIEIRTMSTPSAAHTSRSDDTVDLMSHSDGWLAGGGTHLPRNQCPYSTLAYPPAAFLYTGLPWP
jgi:hypothetical protein